MSDFFEQDPEKQEKLKQIVKDLHAGVPAEKLKSRFAKLIKKTSPEEIANMENALIEEGFPAEEVQKLCDVHVQVFEAALSRVGKPAKIPGHPLFTYLEENKAAQKIMKTAGRLAKKLTKKKATDDDFVAFEHEFQNLRQIEIHYVRKENQLFPALEVKKFTGPTKVMWGKHDEIREHFRQTEKLLQARELEKFYKQVKTLISAIKKLMFLEEKILFPTAARKLTNLEWVKIKQGEPEIGYAWVTPSNLWDADIVRALGNEPAPIAPPAPENDLSQPATLKLAEGALTLEQLNLMLTSLPVDITFVDENDKVCFYSANSDRIFPRSPGIIGRAVQNCHPPKSVHIVDEIVQSFREKKKDRAEFWIQSQGKFIYIRYFPVFNAAGEYKGTIEVTQEVSGIRGLEGERRLLDW